MIKQKIIGWAILFIYAISLLIIFKLKLLGNWDEEKLSMSLFAIYTFVIPSIAWYFIKKQMKKESQRHSRTLFSVQQKKLTFCSFSNGRMKPSSLCRFPTLLFPDVCCWYHSGPGLCAHESGTRQQMVSLWPASSFLQLRFLIPNLFRPE